MVRWIIPCDIYISHPDSEKKKDDLNSSTVLMSHQDLIYHLDNAEMTPELYHDLMTFSFNCLWQHFVKRYDNGPCFNVHGFTAKFLNCLKRLVRYHFYSCVFRIFIR